MLPWKYVVNAGCGGCFGPTAGNIQPALVQIDSLTVCGILAEVMEQPQNLNRISLLNILKTHVKAGMNGTTTILKSGVKMFNGARDYFTYIS